MQPAIVGSAVHEPTAHRGYRRVIGTVRIPLTANSAHVSHRRAARRRQRSVTAAPERGEGLRETRGEIEPRLEPEHLPGAADIEGGVGGEEPQAAARDGRWSPCHAPYRLHRLT